MNEAVEEFGRLLYRGDELAMADLQAALADWRTFYDRHGHDIGIDVPYLKKIWADGAVPWEVLIDVGTLHRFVFEADHREFFDEFVAGVRGLRPAEAMTVDWDALAETDDDEDVDEFLDAMASEVRRAGAALVILDKASDSYPLAIVSPDVLERVRDLAGAISEGEVIVVGEDTELM